MSKLNVAIIGLGVMGQQHARIISELPNANLIGVCDINQEVANKLATEYNTSTYAEMDDLFQDDNVDAVVIATSDHQHREVAVLACQHNKHILIEKPLADTTEDSEAIIEALQQSSSRLMVGHTLRWDSRYIVAKQAVEANQIGEPLHIHARRNNSYENGKRLQGRTSVIKFLGVHDLDAIEWVTNDKITEVYAIAGKKKLKELDVADVIITLLTFESGAVGSYETSWVMPHVDIDAKLDITGSTGALNIDIYNQNLKIYEDGNKVSYPDTAYNIDTYGKQTGFVKEEVATFVNCILEEKEFPITVEEAHRAVLIVEAIEKSIETGQSVKI